MDHYTPKPAAPSVLICDLHVPNGYNFTLYALAVSVYVWVAPY